MKIIKLFFILGAIACTEHTLYPYAIFNRSDESTDRISAIAFKDEKTAMDFLHDLGWTQEVAKVTDKIATAAVAATGALAAPFSAITIASTKIAEAAILDKILHRHPLMFTPAEHEEKIKIIDQDLPQTIKDKKETIKYNYETKIEKAKTAAQKKQLRSERDKKIKEMIDEEKLNAKQKKLEFNTGSIWWWKEIGDKHKEINNPYIILIRKPAKSESILTIDPFEEWQVGAEIADWQIIGAGYLNRAGILVYNGENKTNTIYLPFVKNKSQAKNESLPYKKIIWKKLEQGEKQGLKIYEAMTGCSLNKVKDYFYINDIKKAKEFDHGLSLFFKNYSDHPVHAIFLREKDLATIFEAGGWTKKSMEALAELTKTIGTVAATAAAEATAEGASVAVQPGELVNLTVELVKKMVGDLPEKVTTAIAIDTIEPLDHFKNIFPEALRYSYFKKKPSGAGIRRSPAAIETEFSRLGDTDLIAIVFPSVDNKEDLSAPEFIGNFDSKNFNGIYYWQKPGEVKYLKYDPIKGKVVNEVAVIAAFPVDREEDDVALTEDGKEVVEDLLKETKEEITGEERKRLEDLLD